MARRCLAGCLRWKSSSAIIRSTRFALRPHRVTQAEALANVRFRPIAAMGGMTAFDPKRTFAYAPPMSEIDQALSEVRALIAALPGCTLIESSVRDGRATFELLVEQRDALAALQEVSTAANAELEPWVDLCHESTSWPMRLSLSSMLSPMEGIAHGNLQLVGIHLVWHMHRTALMTSLDSNRLLQRWNAMLVVDA